MRWACDCKVGGGNVDALVHHRGCASQAGNRAKLVPVSRVDVLAMRPPPQGVPGFAVVVDPETGRPIEYVPDEWCGRRGSGRQIFPCTKVTSEYVYLHVPEPLAAE